MKVRWTIPAVHQLENIFDYIAEGNPAAAGRTVHRIREAIYCVARMPHAGRIGRVDGTREVTVPGTSYLIAYRIVEESVHVLAVFHGAQKWPDSF
ncbi:MAG: type II toxin-antitoxin system RelE/ParE family toxin [Terracidiphilus sp.]|nr:type II toxin-antitoxin system RelE/ParE family toxin [Terracidiphilus sp.]